MALPPILTPIGMPTSPILMLTLAPALAHLEDFCRRIVQGLETATFAQKRALVELLIDRVVVTDEEVEIRYVIPTTERSEHTRFYQLRLAYCRTVPS